MEDDTLDTFDLRLYVAGQTPQAIRSFANLQKIIGDLSNTERVLVGLDLRQRQRTTHDTTA
ncbi:MAG TPA: hypothetical protein VI485_30810 [Vicinamibacterales bacterium]|nr:hypothetical protein [Vicinamibacterales bacterium]